MPARNGGGIGETRDGTDGVHEVDGVRGGPRSEAKCTRIARVQTGHSPFELRSRGRSGRNRTFSPSFGGSAGHHDSPTCGIAPRRGIEPLSPHGQWGCDASRITRQSVGGPKATPGNVGGVTYGDRTRLRGFTFHPRPRRVTSPSMAQARCAGGLPWSRTTFFRISSGRYYSTSSQP